MSQDTKYSALDHGGLEVVNRDYEAPEFVAKDHEGPIACKDNEAPQVISRANSLNLPIPTRDETEKEAAHVTALETEEDDSVGTKGRRKYCGLTKKWLILACIALLLVVIAAAVGGAVAAVNKKNASSASASDSSDGGSNDEDGDFDQQITVPGVGFSLVSNADDSGQLLLYFGFGISIYENVQFSNGTWSQTIPGHQTDITDGASGYGSPISAISYYNQGAYVRQIFYQSESGLVLSQTGTKFQDSVTTSWTPAVQLSSNSGAASNSTGLAACVGNFTDGGLDEIRVYYGTNAGLVQELKYSLSDPTSGWRAGLNWTGADTGSGIACSVNNEGSQIDIYWRDATSGSVQQTTALDSDGGTNYTWTQHLLSNANMAQGSDIAVAYDGEQTEYVYFQRSDGVIVRATTALSSHTFDANMLSLQTGAHLKSYTKLAAAWNAGEAWYIYQNYTTNNTDVDAHSIWLSGANRNGLDAGGAQAVLGEPVVD